MALWFWVLVGVGADVLVGIVGMRRKSGAAMVASGAWALFFVGCGFAAYFFDRQFRLFGLPLIGAYGVTMFVLGLRMVFRPGR